mgnify:CR=1 FL=1
MENQNLNILDEVNKGATMGMNAISYVSEKVTDSKFKNVLDIEYNKYKDISNRVTKNLMKLMQWQKWWHGMEFKWKLWMMIAHQNFLNF